MPELTANDIKKALHEALHELQDEAPTVHQHGGACPECVKSREAAILEALQDRELVRGEAEKHGLILHEIELSNVPGPNGQIIPSMRVKLPAR